MSIPMKGLSKRGSYNHLTDLMEFKYSTVKQKSVNQLISYLLQVINLNQL